MTGKASSDTVVLGLQEMEEGNACKLCFETFNEKLRPRCLPCGHSFCKSCIFRLFGNERLTCPKCKREHHAANEEEFPINYDMEEIMSNSKKAEASVAPKVRLGTISKRIQTLIDEQRTSSQNLLLVSEELESQLKEYDNFLETKKTKHEEVFHKIIELANRNEVVIKKITDERQRLTEMQNKVNCLENKVQNKLPNLDDATDTKTAIAAVAELDEICVALEDCNTRCQQQFPNANILTFSNKVLFQSKAVLSLVDSEGDENVPQIPDLSKTNFSILEKIDKIGTTCTLSLQELQNMSQPLNNLVEEGRVYAIQTERGRLRSARLSLKENIMYLHCLQDGEPPAHIFTIKHGEVLNVKDSKEVFLDLSWEGSFRGRVRILLLSPDTPYARQFRMLCTGDLGPSYAHSKFLDVINKGDTINEVVYAGDYENNDGSGGASIVEGIERDDPLYRRPGVEGSVWTCYNTDDESVNAQFGILTGKGDPHGTLCSNVFGQVQHGLDVVKSAAKLNDITSVTIRDCGVVIPL